MEEKKEGGMRENVFTFSSRYLIIVITNHRICIEKEKKSTHKIYWSGCFYEAKKKWITVVLLT